jgi:hypothetical protein
MTSRNTDHYTTKDTDLIDERGTFIVIYNGSKNEKRGCIIGSAPPPRWSMYTRNSLAAILCGAFEAFACIVTWYRLMRTFIVVMIIWISARPPRCLDHLY